MILSSRSADSNLRGLVRYIYSCEPRVYYSICMSCSTAARASKVFDFHAASARVMKCNWNV